MKKLILIVNLGSPEALSSCKIARFLKSFLSDKRVVSLPRLLWYPILFMFILPFRSRSLCSRYKEIWLNGLSPLVYFTSKQSALLEKQYAQDSNVIVKHAFCYSNPSIKSVLDIVKHEQINDLVVLPLYPQFSSTTTAAVFDQIYSYFQNQFYIPKIKFINDFHDHPQYIELIAQQIKNSWTKNKQMDKLIFSFHSLPNKLQSQGDPYYEQCINTAKLVAEYLKLSIDNYIVSFQSKFGVAKWLQPATKDVLCNLANKGLSVDIIAPGFVSDCLETLEELKILNAKWFIENGGSTYNYIECLNASPDFINFLNELTES